MSVDTKKLRNGEKVICNICLKGELVPCNNASPEKANRFFCTNCGEKLIINIRIPKSKK